MKITAYTYCAGYHCPSCTRFDSRDHQGRLRPIESSPRAHREDENGIREDLEDPEGNLVMPVFSTDEVPDEGIYCDGCGEEIESARTEDCHFNRFSLTLHLTCVRDCSAQGDVTQAVERWAEGRTIDWEKIDPKDIAAELKEFGSWTPEELSDDRANRRRILWLAACQLKEELADRE